MTVQTAEAIVLRQYSLSDSDKIIVFFSREFGKIRAVAQGVKKPKSRLGGCLEPLNHIRLEFWMREGRDLCQIRQAELVYSYLGKNPNLPKIYAFSYFAEIANELVQDNQPNHALFRLLLASLETGYKHTVSLSLVRYFEIWSLRISGLLPDYAYCSNCGKCVKDDGFFAWLEAGQTRCAVCAEGRGLRISGAAAEALELMSKLSPEQFSLQSVSKDAAAEIERLSQRLLSLHLEKQLKSYRILREVLQSQ
jgi:DNA repair protein RecO (recombination protein O)